MIASCATLRWLHFQGTRGWLRSPDASHVAGWPGGRDRRVPGRVDRGPSRRRRDDVDDRAGGQDRHPHRPGRGHRHRHADRAPRDGAARLRRPCSAVPAGGRVPRLHHPAEERPRARAGRAQRAGAAGQPAGHGPGHQQAGARLGPRILALDAVLATLPGHRVVEVHPELSFAELAGHVLDRKKSPAGVEQRLTALSEWIPGARGLVAMRPRGVPVDDALDALAALWSAVRWRDGLARTLPHDATARPVHRRVARTRGSPPGRRCRLAATTT